MRRRSRLKTGNEGWLTSYADLITNLLIFFMLIVSASEIQVGKLDSLAASISTQKNPKSLSQAENDLKAEIQKENLIQEVDVQLTQAGLELSFNAGLTFSSGGAEIRAEMERPLQKVMQLLVPYSSTYRFAIEGHTDEAPVKRESLFKSNWDLAAARALQVRDRMEWVGLPKSKMRVEAYADTKPLPSEKLLGLIDDQRLSKHRRVIIRLY